MAAITISRQLGSFGREIAQLTADRLGFRLVWREVINQAARLSGAPEAALAEIDELGLLGVCPSARACRAYRQAVQQVIEDLAGEGRVVIVGRGGQVILRGRPEVLHVRLYAPAALRAARVAERLQISDEAAAAQVEASDRFRRNYLRRFFKRRWDDSDLYDVMLNTANLEPVEAAAVICQAYQARSNSQVMES